jgi:GT2 family glycosyltransferase
MTGGDRLGAVVPMMKFFNLRGFVNGIGNQIWNHGWGTDNFIGHVDVGQFSGLEEVPSACFGAVFLRREAVDDIGLLDEKYGSFYEDTDWSYRCWMRGWRIAPQAGAVVYHKFGGSYLAGPKLRFVVRNRQRLVLKIFQGKVMLGTFRRYMKEDIRNFLALLKQKNFGLAGAYPKAYGALALGLGTTLLKRRRFRKSRLPGLRELDVLRKNIPFYHCLDPKGRPQLSASVLLGYYRWELAKLRRSETGGERPGPADPREKTSHEA